MSNGGFTKVTAKTAGEVARQFELGEPAAALLRDGLTPRQFLDLLAEKALYVDAIRFLAYALPKRETVWWALQCARKASGPTPPSKVAAALQATEKWVLDPKDEHRWAARAAAEKLGNEHPAGLAAFSVFWTGGSITPEGQHPVPAPEHLTALIAAGAVMLSTVLTEGHKAPEKYQQYLALGYDIASGKSLWKST